MIDRRRLHRSAIFTDDEMTESIDTVVDEQQPAARRIRLRLVLAAVAAVIVVILILVRPAMPRQILLFTDSQDSAWFALGQRFADDLRRRGLEVDLVATEGTLDNVRRLNETPNAVALAPATVNQWEESDGTDWHLAALGSIGFEPVWLFVRSDTGIRRLPDLKGRRIITEGEGTTGEHVAQELLQINDLTDEVQLESITGLTAAQFSEQMASESVDAGLICGDADSPLVQAALALDGVEPLSFERAAAYAGLIPGVTQVVAPEGALDLARNIPSEDLQLLATTTCLIAHEDLHPAVVPLLLKTAENVREKRTAFSTDATFPGTQNLTLPLDPAARRYFSQGESGLLNKLPYRANRILSHFGLFVLPLLVVVAAGLKLVPAALQKWFQLRLQGWLKELAAVEKRHAGAHDREELMERLNRIDQASAAMFVPRTSSHDYIDFRQFLHDLRDRVQQPGN